MPWRAIWRWVFILICCPVKGSILFESGLFWASETEGSVKVVLVRKGDVSASASVDFEIRFQGIIATDDFINPRGRVQFPPGETKTSVNLEIKTDGKVEETEWFDIFLQN